MNDLATITQSQEESVEVEGRQRDMWLTLGQMILEGRKGDLIETLPLDEIASDGFLDYCLEQANRIQLTFVAGLRKNIGKGTRVDYHILKIASQCADTNPNGCSIEKKSVPYKFTKLDAKREDWSARFVAAQSYAAAYQDYRVLFQNVKEACARNRLSDAEADIINFTMTLVARTDTSLNSTRVKKSQFLCSLSNYALADANYQRWGPIWGRSDIWIEHLVAQAIDKKNCTALSNLLNRFSTQSPRRYLYESVLHTLQNDYLRSWSAIQYCLEYFDFDALKFEISSIEMLPSPEDGVSEKKVKESKTIESAIADLFDALSGLNCQLILMAGTLLGYCRSGGILVFDKDVDFAVINSTPESREAIAERLKQHPAFELALVEDENVGFKHLMSTLAIDIFYLDSCDQNLIQTVRLPYGPVVKLSFSNFSLKPIEFLGQKFYIPTEPEKMLEENYGDWKTEDRYFQTLVEAPNLLHADSLAHKVFCYQMLLKHLIEHSPQKTSAENQKLKHFAHRTKRYIEHQFGRLGT